MRHQRALAIRQLLPGARKPRAGPCAESQVPVTKGMLPRGQCMQATHERGSLGVTHLALGLFPPSSLMLCRPRSHADTSIGPKGLATVLCCRSQAASILPRAWRNSFGSEKACGKGLGQFHTQQKPQLLKIGNIFQSRPPPTPRFGDLLICVTFTVRLL